jgi:hypothetical protein
MSIFFDTGTKTTNQVSWPSPAKADRLMHDIRTQMLPHDAEFFDWTEYGPKYRIRGTLTGPDGRVLRVVSIWMKEDATGETKFVTLFPDNR